MDTDLSEKYMERYFTYNVITLHAYIFRNLDISVASLKIPDFPV
jgi:hypothetical protein